MPSLTLGAVPEPRADWAVQFFRDWFGDERKLFSTVMLINPTKQASASGRTRHFHEPPVDFREMFEEQTLSGLIYFEDAHWNAYYGVGLMLKSPGPRRKGGKNDIVRVPGIWVDLDVGKDGVFESEEHALTLLRSVRPYPTIVVATGTGGVHAYWKVRGGLDAQAAEDLVTRWWTYLCSVADAKIDKLTNCDRVMKLPGSIRWEKDPGDQPSLVRLIYSSDATVAVSELTSVSESAWADYRSRIAAKKAEVQASRASLIKLTTEDLANAGKWGTLLTAVSLEDEFNETHSWHEVLEPLGWTDIGSDSEGRTLWARPDQTKNATYKSAATGYNGSHVMTLFSDSPVTGLWSLAEAGIALTKYRVWVQTRFGGDDLAFARHFHGLDVDY